MLQVLDTAPLRLYRNKDVKLSTVLWGIERSTASLQQKLNDSVYGEDTKGGDGDDHGPSESETEEEEEEETIEEGAEYELDVKLNTPTADRLVEAAKHLL